MSQPTPRDFKDAAYTHLAEIGKALASPVRLELLELLAQAPLSVELLAAQLHQSVANTSHHLQALKRAQLVSSRRDGAYITYTLASAEVAALLGALYGIGFKHSAALSRLSQDFFSARDGLEPIGLEELRQRLKRGDALLLDVRPAHEFEAHHLPGARSIPLDELEARVHELPRDQTIIAYCRGPLCAFSADAAQRLRALGFKDVRRAAVSPYHHDLTP